MSNPHRVDLHPAFVLHTRPYRETSVIVEAFSEGYGRISLVAKGVRRKGSRLQSLLQLFRPLLLSWRGKSALQTLNDAEANGPMYQLSGERLISAFYINELMMRLLHPHDPQEMLFNLYREILERLQAIQQADSSVEQVLRSFEKTLLELLGYGLVLEHEVTQGDAIIPERRYCYLPEHGPQLMNDAMQPGVRVQGSTLLALAADLPLSGVALKEAKQLMRAVLAVHLGGKPLRSRELMKKIV